MRQVIDSLVQQANFSPILKYVSYWWECLPTTWKGQAEQSSSCSLIRGRKLQFSSCAGVRWSKPLTSAIITHAKLPTERERQPSQRAGKHALRIWHTLIKGIHRVCFVCLYARSLSRFYATLSRSSKACSSLTCFDIGSNNNLSWSDQAGIWAAAAARLTWAIWAPVSEKWCVCLCPGRYDATAGWFLGSLWSVARVTRMCAAPQHTPNDRTRERQPPDVSPSSAALTLSAWPLLTRLSLRKLSLSASPTLQDHCLLFISLGDWGDPT